MHISSIQHYYKLKTRYEHPIQLALQICLCQHARRHHSWRKIRTRRTVIWGRCALVRQGPNLQHFQQYFLLYVGLIGCSLVSSPSVGLKIAAVSFMAAQLLFITPLYVSAINGKSPMLSKLMPAGGGSMMIGWVSLIFAWFNILTHCLHALHLIDYLIYFMPIKDNQISWLTRTISIA